MSHPHSLCQCWSQPLSLPAPLKWHTTCTASKENIKHGAPAKCCNNSTLLVLLLRLCYSCTFDPNLNSLHHFSGVSCAPFFCWLLSSWLVFNKCNLDGMSHLSGLSLRSLQSLGLQLPAQWWQRSQSHCPIDPDELMADTQVTKMSHVIVSLQHDQPVACAAFQPQFQRAFTKPHFMPNAIINLINFLIIS